MKTSGFGVAKILKNSFTSFTYFLVNLDLFADLFFFLLILVDFSGFFILTLYHFYAILKLMFFSCGMKFNIAIIVKNY